MIFHRTPEAAPALAAAAVAMFSWGGAGHQQLGFARWNGKKTSLAMQVRNCCGRTMTGRTMYFASWCALRVW